MPWHKHISQVTGRPTSCPSNWSSILDVNLPSITIPNGRYSVSLTRSVTNVGAVDSEYKAVIDPPPGNAIKVEPDRLVFFQSHGFLSSPGEHGILFRKLDLVWWRACCKNSHISETWFHHSIAGGSTETFKFVDVNLLFIKYELWIKHWWSMVMICPFNSDVSGLFMVEWMAWYCPSPFY